MSITRRLLVMAETALGMGAVLISDAFDNWFAEESRESLIKRLRENAEHGAELALENERLRDEIDGLRFNGPSLYSDEVALLKEYVTILRCGMAFARCETDDEKEARIDQERDMRTLNNLLERCDHLPMTAADLAMQVKGIADGTIKTVPWDPDDHGSDVDEWPDDGFLWGEAPGRKL